MVFRLILSLFAFSLLLNVHPAGAAQHSEHKVRLKKNISILFVSSFTKDLPAQVQFEKGLKTELNSGNKKYEIYFEFMESPKIPDKNIRQCFKNYLGKKYKGIKLDYIILWAPVADSFFKSHGDIFPDAHRIYIEPGIHSPKNISPGKETEIGIKMDYQGTIERVIRLHNPDLFYLIGTTDSDNARERIERFEESIKSVAPGKEIIYIIDKTIDEITEILSSPAKKNSAAFYLLMFSDGKGTPQTPFEVAAILTQKSKIPVFSFWESLMGSGITGGYLLSLNEIGRQIGIIILSNQTKGSVENITAMREVYDWRSLKKWNINTGKIPSNALIINRPENILSTHRWGILSVFAAMTILILLVAALNRALRLKRKAFHELDIERQHLEKKVEERTWELSRANEELTLSHERYRSLSDAALEGIFLIKDGRIVDANNRACIMFGYDLAELMGLKVIEFIDMSHRNTVNEKIQEGVEGSYEAMGLKKNGTSFAIEVSARVFEYKNERIRVTAIRDLTSQKESERKIMTLQNILPMCSSCKKIRDESGTWRSLEEYMEENTATQISHGLCPSCEKKLYHDLEK